MKKDINVHPNLATQNALDLCAAWISNSNQETYIAGTNSYLIDHLFSRLHLTPEIQFMRLPALTRYQRVEDVTDLESDFTLVLIQPNSSYLELINQISSHSEGYQLVVLQASWLGALLFPEWKPNPDSKIVRNKFNWWKAKNKKDWLLEQRTIGNFQSLFWGLLSGRLLSINRSDLMDRCASRVRFHVFPNIKKSAFAYLYLTRVIPKKLVGDRKHLVYFKADLINVTGKSRNYKKNNPGY